MDVTLVLPYPPSANTYWRRSGRHMHISAGGVAFREAVLREVEGLELETLTGPLEVMVVLHPADRRRRDIDNVFKPLFDSLMHGGLIEDDSQIRRLTASFGAVVPDGETIVRLVSIQEDE